MTRPRVDAATRMPRVDAKNLTPEQQRVYDLVLSGPRKSLDGPLWVWLTSPALAAHVQDYGAFCRFETIVSRRYVELAILIMAAHWRAGFEWAVHAPAARKEGLSDELIESIRRGEVPAFETGADRIIYEFCENLLHRRRMPEAVYWQVRDILGETGTVELVGVLGYYALVSMTIATFDVPLPAGAGDPFADLG